jgi:hypothetical protein
MTIPKYPYELLVYDKSGKQQTREFETLRSAWAAADGLKPSLCHGWRLSIVLATHTFPDWWKTELRERR